MPAGEYTVIGTNHDFSGYRAVSADSAQEDIEANELFENNSYLSVTEG